MPLITVAYADLADSARSAIGLVITTRMQDAFDQAREIFSATVQKLMAMDDAQMEDLFERDKALRGNISANLSGKSGIEVLEHYVNVTTPLFSADEHDRMVRAAGRLGVLGKKATISSGG